jgi:hypothetical protein
VLLFEGADGPQPQSTMIPVDGFDLIDSIGSDELELVFGVNFLQLNVGNVEDFSLVKFCFITISVAYFGAILKYFEDSG